LKDLQISDLRARRRSLWLLYEIPRENPAKVLIELRHAVRNVEGMKISQSNKKIPGIDDLSIARSVM